MPDVMLQRHCDTVVQYQTRFTEMQQKLQTLLNADSLPEQSDAATALNDWMQPQKLKRSHQKVDPHKLPWSTPGASRVRKPTRIADESALRLKFRLDCFKSHSRYRIPRFGFAEAECILTFVLDVDARCDDVVGR